MIDSLEGNKEGMVWREIRGEVENKKRTEGIDQKEEIIVRNNKKR